MEILRLLNRKTGAYQVITNFLLSKPEFGGFPCPRYSRVHEALEQKREIRGSDVAAILASVTQFGEEKGRQGGTLYSTVHNLLSREFVLFYKCNFQQPIKFSLAEELRKGNHSIRIETLFKS